MQAWLVIGFSGVTLGSWLVILVGGTVNPAGPLEVEVPSWLTTATAFLAGHYVGDRRTQDAEVAEELPEPFVRE